MTLQPGPCSASWEVKGPRTHHAPGVCWGPEVTQTPFEIEGDLSPPPHKDIGVCYGSHEQGNSWTPPGAGLGTSVSVAALVFISPYLPVSFCSLAADRLFSNSLSVHTADRGLPLAPD